MDLKMGSNVFRNTNGVLVIQGKAQIVLELRAEQHQLLLTMDLYDAEAKHLAHVRRNTLAFNRDNLFTCTTGPESVALFTPTPWVRLSHKQTDERVFEARIEDTTTVAVPTGRFHTHTGHFVEISSHYCRIGDAATMFGHIVDLHGGPVILGEENMSPKSPPP